MRCFPSFHAVLGSNYYWECLKFYYMLVIQKDPENRKCFMMFQNYIVSFSELNDAFDSLNFIKRCHEYDNTYFNSWFQTLLRRLVYTKPQKFGTLNILILKFFWYHLITEQVTINLVVAYHKHYLLVFDEIARLNSTSYFKQNALVEEWIKMNHFHKRRSNI